MPATNWNIPAPGRGRGWPRPADNGAVRPANTTSRRAILGMALVATASSFLPRLANAADTGPAHQRLWNSLELNLGAPAQFIQQAEVLARPVVTEHGFEAEARAWNTLVAALRGLDPTAQIQLAHKTLQRVAYRSDSLAEPHADRWLRPLQFIRHGGDCEDFAIAKFKALEAAGFPSSRMRLAIVHADNSPNFHAVLAAFIDGEAYILDNLSPGVYHQKHRLAYDPICSMNNAYLWLHWHGSNLDKRVALLRSTLNRFMG